MQRPRWVHDRRGITLGPRGTCCQGYLGLAKMYLELLELLLELLLQLLQQQLRQFRVHFGKTQVPLAIGTPLAQGEKGKLKGPG